ncbi:uncharacterized protein KY384_001320 [Bacidia gigantensis]|uniref:uncharacterized protein n=1 Tax=Bacidia gigantensis TaxID=2732470 RepID=UPI001D04FAC1|nr:uncharacterized protein KY384_001320 [Bacidia gigantensis]KAG8533580.1 hypothetical protein KY384_001320 [Bacidia gigantensis]
MSSSSQHPPAILDSTSSHPPSGPSHPDATSSTAHSSSQPTSDTKPLNAPAKDRLPSPHTSSTSQFASRTLDTQSQPQAQSSTSLASPPDPSDRARTTAYITAAKSLLTSHIPSYPDFPEQGILFYDILPLFYSPQTHTTLLNALNLLITLNFSPENRPDLIVGLEARGFLFGPSLARLLNIGFVPVRKPGKLPGKIETAEYQKEYGVDKFEIQAEGISKGKKVLVVDDVIATGKAQWLIRVTGGSAAACGDLVEKLGGVLLGYIFLLELEFLKGREKLGAPVHSLLTEKDMEEKD